MVEAAKGATAVTACCLNWRYAPAIQTAWRAIRVRPDRRCPRYPHGMVLSRPKGVPCPDTMGAPDGCQNGSMGEGLSHDFDKARFLTGAEFVSLVSSVTGLTIKQDGDFLVEGGRSDASRRAHGVVSWASSVCRSVSVRHRWSLVVVGDEGSLWIPDATTTVIRQRSRRRQTGDAGYRRLGTSNRPPRDLLQHTWNRLVEDFIAAIREDDQRHESFPSLAQLSDGLRTEEVIAAARRSSTERRWVSVGTSTVPSHAAGGQTAKFEQRLSYQANLPPRPAAAMAWKRRSRTPACPLSGQHNTVLTWVALLICGASCMRRGPQGFASSGCRFEPGKLRPCGPSQGACWEPIWELPSHCPVGRGGHTGYASPRLV